MIRKKVPFWMAAVLAGLGALIVFSPDTSERKPKPIAAPPKTETKPSEEKFLVTVRTRIYITPRIIDARQCADGTICATIKVDMPPGKVAPTNAFVEFDVQPIHKLHRLECKDDLIYAYMRMRNVGEKETVINFDRRTHPDLFKNSILDRITVVERPAKLPSYH